MSKPPQRAAMIFAMAVVTAACAAQNLPPLFTPLSDAERAALVTEGRHIAQSQCRACHAVGADDVSPRHDAAPLRDILQGYDSAALAGNLMIGVRVGHPDMPQFHLGPREADALVEYLDAIRAEPQD
jgi:mono/diheme cytochrome c family protein